MARRTVRDAKTMLGGCLDGGRVHLELRVAPLFRLPEDEEMTLEEREHVMQRTRERESVNVPTGSIPTELGRLIEEALQCLEGTDFHGASVALQKACAEAASSCDAAGLPGHFVADDGRHVQS